MNHSRNYRWFDQKKSSSIENVKPSAKDRANAENELQVLFLFSQNEDALIFELFAL